MVKIEFFKISPENSKVISDFMDSVNVIQDGILISDGYVGIMHKTLDDIGMSNQNCITAVAGELAKSQKQFVLQDGLTRAYTGVISSFEAKRAEFDKGVAECQLELDKHNESYDDTLEKQVADLNEKIKENTVSHQQAPKAEKDAWLQKYVALNKELEELLPKYEAYRKEFDAKSSEISARMGSFAVESANILSEIKENSGFLETATKDREHARIFINSTKQYISELEAGTIVIG